MIFGKKGQGAIEYLLLLAAAIVVVAIVISFLVTTIGPVEDSGDERKYNYLCGPMRSGGIDSNTEDCACYTGNDKNYFPNNTSADQNGLDTCCAKSSPALKNKWNCSK